MRWMVFAAWLGAVGVAHAGVAVVGLGSDATFSTRPGRWRHTFVAYMDGDKQKLPALSVSITDFQSDSGKRAQPARPVATELFGGTADQRDAAAFTISVEVAEPDAYVATIVVSGGDQPLVRQLTLQVGHAAAPTTAVPAAVVGPSGVEAIGDQATLKLGVRNVSSVEHTFTVAPPSVMRKRGERLLPADLVARASVATLGGPFPDGKLHLAGGADGFVQLEIQGAPPGEYAVEVSLGEPGMAPTKILGAVFIKRGILYAIVLIAIGVLLASGISRIRDVWLDSQAQRINLGRVLERLQLEPSGDAARDALRELKQQGEDLARAITDRRDCRADIENLGRRAVVFARANASAAEISELDDDRRGELRRKLDEVFRLVPLPTGDTAAADKLAELEDKDAERTALKAAIDAFAASLDDHRIEADAAFTAQLGELSGRVARVRELYQRDELDAAQGELVQIRDLLGKHGRDAIQRACDLAPAWTSEASWARATAEVKAQLAAPGTRYDALRTAFVDAMATLTVMESKHPDAPQLAAAKDVSSKLQLMAKIHAETGPVPRSLPLALDLFTAPPIRALAPPKAEIERRLIEPFAWRALARRSTRVELLVIGVVMAVAIVAGVKALWVDNPTWGSWGDLLGAFLWGSGVQVGAEAFVGLAALRTALGRRT